MLLENLMEDKQQLDFSQPLLSVRRVPSPTTVVVKEADWRNRKPAPVPPQLLPHYRPELKSGPVRVPGSVPFMWERSPGRPKNGTTCSDSLPPLVPRLPPGRRPLNVKQVASDAGSKGSSSLAASSPPKTRNGFSTSSNSPTAVKGEEKSGEVVMDEPRSSGIEEEEDDDEEDSFLDALDTLSRTESLYLNCSITGVSGLDNLETIPTRTHSGDLQAREFMIGRFLPAAQAMASESPQYSTQYPSKKQPILREQASARQITGIERFEKHQPPSKCSRENVFPHYAQVDNANDDDDCYSEPDTPSLGICGLLPLLCLQNSSSPLNHVPRIRNPAHMRASSVRTISNIGNKYNQAATYERRIPHEPRPYKAPQSNAGWSHNEPSQPPASEEQCVHGIPDKDSDTVGSIPCVKEGISFGELLANDDIERKLGSGSPVVEKTLYIDSVHTVKKLKNSDSTSSEKKGLTSDKEIKDIVSLDCSFQEAKKSKLVNEKEEEEEEELEHFGSFSSCYLSFSDNEGQLDIRRDQELILAPAMPAHNEDGKKNNRVWSVVSKGDAQGPLKQFTNLTRPKLAGERGKDNFQNQNNTRLSQQKPCYGNSINPIAPPLLKSPSESWLKRALPTVASKTQQSKSTLGILVHPKAEGYVRNSSDQTWETIVKTSGRKNRALQQFSEGQLAAIPEA